MSQDLTGKREGQPGAGSAGPVQTCRPLALRGTCSYRRLLDKLYCSESVLLLHRFLKRTSHKFTRYEQFKALDGSRKDCKISDFLVQ